MASGLSLGPTHFLQFSIQWSSIALLYWDYALTFPLEVKYIWQAKLKVSSVLYFFCRYGLVANVVYLATLGGKVFSCDTGYIIAATFSILGRFGVVVVWSARTYAVYSRNKWIMSYFGILSASIVALQIIHIPTVSCLRGSTMPIMGGLIAILMVIIEFSSAGLTFFRCIQTFQSGSSWRDQRRGFMYLIFEQGVIYFSVAAILALASLTLNLTVTDGFFQRLLNAYNLPMSGMFTARFLLHLRRYEMRQFVGDSTTDFEGNSRLTALNFKTKPTVNRSFASVVDEFGDDPVARAKRVRQRRGSDIQVTTHTPHLSSADKEV